METGDSGPPSSGGAVVKVEEVQEINGTGSTTPESECVGDAWEGGSGMLTANASETYSVLMAELHKDINTCGFPHKEELLEFFGSRLKPLLDKFANGMSKVHQLSEQLQLALEVAETPSTEGKAGCDRQSKLCVASLHDVLYKTVFEKNTDYLISSDRTCLLSNLEDLGMELRDCKQRHQMTVQGLHQSLHDKEEHDKALMAQQQQSLQSYESQVQCLQQLLQVLEGDVEALQRTLQLSQEENKRLKQDFDVHGEGVGVLREELAGCEACVQALRQELLTSQECAMLLQKNLQASEELCGSLQQHLEISEKKVQTMQEAAELWEGQARAAETQIQQQKEDLTAEHEQEVKRITEAFSVARENMESQQRESQRALDEAMERERSLHETLTAEKDKHTKAIQELQEGVDRANQERIEVEQDLRGQLIGLKKQLVDELSRANKKLEESAKHERELQNVISDLRRGFRQKECNSSALDFLRQRHRDVVRMQRLMEANIQSCAPAAVALSHSGPLRTQSNLLQPQEQLWAQPEEKAHLDSVMSKEEPEQRADGPLTQDWEEVLRKAEQWQKEAQLITEVKGACDIRGKNCAYSLLSMDCHKLKSRNSLYSYNEVNSLDYARLCGKAKSKERDTNNGQFAPSSTVTQARAHTAVLHRPVAGDICSSLDTNHDSLISVQSRLRNLQSVDFQNRLKEFLHMP
ncbi:centrosome-associated protein CEP250-like isoform X2 [Engraulis encrasicolus]|uniref:centrosome-associated protein CEP250-like isoform X2 n=1 Tax=Engraulis encrasicolus TaxID=184585 RepID=UPI002FD0156B